MQAGPCILRAVRPSDFKNLSALCADIKVRDIERYTSEWFGRTSNIKVVARPRSVHEVSDVLKYCNSSGIGVTVFGGNTGLVGGTMAERSEVAISTEFMNRFLEIDVSSGIATVETGLILQNLQERLAIHHLTTPYDLGARGSCTIGGNLATNAGGINFIRHGPLRAHVVGIEAVLANGDVLDLMSKSRKDNCGIDLKQIFIGSEGTLGIITKARIHCPSLHQYRSVALISLKGDFTSTVLETLKKAKETIGESLSAFEFIDGEGAELVGPLPSGMDPKYSGFAVLVEASGSASVSDKIENFLEQLPDSVEGVVGSDLESMSKLWHYRELLPVKMASLGHNLKYDISLPQRELYKLVEGIRLRYANRPDVLKIVGYGHVGDGNLHLNVALDPQFERNPSLESDMSHSVYSYVSECGGSISAEHGIGRDKLEQLFFSKPTVVLEYTRALKKMLDPNGILNPGRTIL
jgi:D-2-hydroxyglutarate dehydrogenase